MDKIEELENRLRILERRLDVAILALNEVLREFEKVNQSIRQKRERGKDEAQEIG